MPVRFHPRQDETFVVEKGALRFRVGADERVHGAGETILVPARVPHRANNADAAAPTVVRWEVRPALLARLARWTGRDRFVPLG